MTTTATTAPEYVDPCPGMKGDDTVTANCLKCSGSGEVNYGNVTFAVTDSRGRFIGERRTCFDCNGSGKHVRLVKNIRSAARREHKAAVARIEEQAALAVERTAFAAAQPVLAERLAAIFVEAYGDGDLRDDATVVRAMAAEKVYGEFVLHMANKANYRGLTDNEVTAVLSAIADREAAAARKAERLAAKRHFGAKGEKVTATGTIVTSMSVDGYAYGSTDRLVIIEGTGDFEGVTFKAVGSGATLFDTERGDVVEFTATVKKHAEYREIPQTVVTRAKIKVLASA